MQMEDACLPSASGNDAVLVLQTAHVEFLDSTLFQVLGVAKRLQWCQWLMRARQSFVSSCQI